MSGCKDGVLNTEEKIHKEQKEAKGSSNIRESPRQIACHPCSQRLTQFSDLHAHTQVLIVLVLSYYTKVHVRQALSLPLSLSLSLLSVLCCSCLCNTSLESTELHVFVFVFDSNGDLIFRG